MKKLVAVLIVVIISAAMYLNAGNGSKIPEGWYAAGSNPAEYTMGTDNSVHYSGNSSAFIKSDSPKKNQFGTLMQTISADKFTGKRIRLTGYIKSENVTGRSGMWMRIDGVGGKQLEFDNMQNRAVRGTTDWKQYSIVLDVPDNSASINFGVLVGGDGEVWFDDLKLEEVGKDVAVTNLIKERKLPDTPSNMDFEE